jgi:hypothetical protein
MPGSNFKEARLKKILPDYWPLLLAIFIFFALMAGIVVFSLKLTNGHFVYTQDDPYISMATARNWVRYGVWGVDRYHFSSSTSSLLWPLLLAICYKLFGVHATIPLALNLLLVCALLITANGLLQKRSLSHTWIAITLFAMILMVPLPLLVTSGLEHTLHSLSILLLLFYGTEQICRKGLMSRYDTLMLGLLSMFAVMSRYESVALIAIIILALALRKRFLASLITAVAASIPIIIWGLISLHYGAYFLPNSILLKSRVPAVNAANPLALFLSTSVETVMAHPFLPVLSLFPLLYLLFSRMRGDIESSLQTLNLLFFLMDWAQILFGKLDSFYRYDGYVILSGVMVIAIDMDRMLRGPFPEIGIRRKIAYASNTILILTGIGIVSMGFQRGVNALAVLPRGSANIYEQQYQMGLFVRQFYTGETVAANDIGCINYLADIHCLDIWGLADMNAAKLRIQGDVNTQTIGNLVKGRGAGIVMIYDAWFPNAIPRQWTREGQWIIPYNIVDGGNAVSFYAPSPNDRDKLLHSLRRFSSHLPAEALQCGAYTLGQSGIH